MLKNNPILKLFVIVPVGFLISFVIMSMGGTSISSYFSLITTIAVLALNFKKTKKILIPLFFSLYSILNVALFPGSVNANARETIAFVFCLASLYSSDYIRIQLEKIPFKTCYNFFKWFSLLFVLCYIITAFFLGVAKVTEDYNTGELRVYYNGFVISHQFSYYAILLAFIFLKYKKYFLFFVLSVLAVSVGNRTSYLVFISAMFIFLETNSDHFARWSRFMNRVVLISILALLFILLFNSPKIFSWYSLSNYLLDTNNISFTSGRMLFWYNGIESFIRNVPFLGVNFFFGLGPDSVERLSTELYDIPFWMHNDYMQIFYCYGLVGFSLYLHALYYFCKKVKNKNVVWFILITSMLNGFYMYSPFQLIVMLFIISNKKMVKNYTRKNIEL